MDGGATDVDVDVAGNVLGTNVETGRRGESRHRHACYPVAPHGFVDDGIEVRKSLCIIVGDRIGILPRKVLVDFIFEFPIAASILEQVVEYRRESKSTV